jgi:hypothetical protein
MHTRSASLRVWPEDLSGLKAVALSRAGDRPEFRQAAEAFFGTADPALLAAQPRERFFEFLMNRTFAAHPEVFTTLSRGEAMGLAIRRTGDDARVEATLQVSVEGRKELVLMRVDMKRSADLWFVRL